jgi:hypothetical protein
MSNQTASGCQPIFTVPLFCFFNEVALLGAGFVTIFPVVQNQDGSYVSSQLWQNRTGFYQTNNQIKLLLPGLSPL